MTFIPDNDGIDHINIYSKSRSVLGRMLSNWYFLMEGIETEDGTFATIEGYWFWLKTDHPKRDILRKLSGHEAKDVGSKFSRGWPLLVDSSRFRSKIAQALRLKVLNLPWLYSALAECNLPLVHYYVYGDRKVPAGPAWLVEEWESIREEIQQGRL